MPQGSTRTSRRVLVALGSVQIICATYNLLSKWALDAGHVDPLLYCFYRDMCATPILLALARHFDGSNQPKFTRQEMWRLFFLGFTGLFGNQVLFIYGLQRTSPFIASIVSQTQPVFSSVLAMTLGLEKQSAWILVGVASAVLGAVIAVGGSDIMEKTELSTGLLILLLGDLAMAVYFIIQKPMLLSRRFQPLTITAYSYAFGAAQLLLMVIFATRWWESETWSLSSEAIVALFFAVAMNSVFKYGMLSVCNRELDVSTLTLWSTLIPILTAAGDFVFFGEQLHMRHVVGFACVCIGLAINLRIKQGGDANEAVVDQADAATFLLGEPERSAHSNRDDEADKGV